MAMLVCLSPSWADYPAISLTAESFEYDRVAISQLEARLETGGQFSIRADSAEFEGLQEAFGRLSVDGVLEYVDSGQEGLQVRSSLQSGGFAAQLELSAGAGNFSASLDFVRQDLAVFTGLEFLPPEFEWLSKGYLDSRLQVRFQSDNAGELQLELGFGELAFDSPDGRFAGEALSIGLDIEADADDWFSPRVTGKVRSGELLVDDFYRDFSDGGLEFSFLAAAGENQWAISDLRVSDHHSLELEGRATVQLLESAELTGIEVSRLELNFPGAYSRYIEPVLAPWTLNGLQLTGQVNWSGVWAEGDFQSGDLLIKDLSVVDIERNRFALTGLDARMRPGDHGFDSMLAWRGLLVGKINLGQGEAALDSEPGAFAITQPVRLDVLGGSLNLQELNVQLPGAGAGAEGEPDIRLRLDLENLDMEQVTQALGWPVFSGRISGQIPGVRLDDGVLDVEGNILVSVFDGLISLDQLRIERPFGVLPSLAANVEAENLDLQLLTSTFSFGQISGRIDGYVRDLRMLDWKPVAFDAWLGTPERQKDTKGISRQAVNHLTTLGGGSATTALTSPLMKLFNNFSYKRLGFGCRMQNNICQVRGVSEDDVSVLIMEGAGVPKITIRAYNRSVDWPQLLAHLAAASEGEGIRVGD